MKTKSITTKNYLLLIDEEAEINLNDHIVAKDLSGVAIVKEYKIAYILAIELSGIELGITHLQISDWIKIIAYYPLTKEAKELDLPLLPNPFKDDMEILLNKDIPSCFSGVKGHENEDYNKGHRDSWIKGYKAAQSKQYSLEDVIAFGKKCFYRGFDKSKNDDANCYTAWREESSDLIQSLSLQQLSKEFIPEYEEYEVIGVRDADGYPLWSKRLKTTTTNSEGKQELVGRYK